MPRRDENGDLVILRLRYDKFPYFPTLWEEFAWHVEYKYLAFCERLHGGSY